MGKSVILCIDDEQLILSSLKAQLKRNFGKDYLFDFAESADEGLEILEELGDENTEVLLIVSDWLMPGMKGDEFLVKVHERYPTIVKVMLTGQADDDAVERAKTEANLHRLLAKPWEETELVEAIRTGLSS